MNSIDDITPNQARLRSTPKSRSVHIGDIRVSYVHDGWIQLHPTLWLPNSSTDYWADHPQYLDDDGYLRAGMGGLLVETPTGTVLIDAGFGPRQMTADPDTPRFGAITGGSFLDSLTALGVRPAQIDVLAFTHLHLDHIGWVSAPDPTTGQPPFAHARVVMTAAEWDHGTSDEHGPFEETMKALEPRLELVSDGSEFSPGITLRSAPGHSAGHAVYEIASNGQRLIAFGDLFHSPVQIAKPHWPAQPDIDTERSTQSRHAILQRLTQDNTLGFGIHFADVTFGRVVVREHGCAVGSPSLPTRHRARGKGPPPNK
ncbi:MBL fold metallo-hydrolase (plasmid) [Rhodococcus opacus]|nr:MBL fold metallo-hydrolase [Rhodococcus opacus]WKN52626.1 MBL fold metallo-hydrolase [Rhodococcus opacus]